MKLQTILLSATPLLLVALLVFRPLFIKNATQLAIVAAALHEGIHAYYDDKEATVIIDEQKTELENTFEFLKPFDPQHPLSQEEVNSMEHNQMAEDYVNQLTSALKEYYPISGTRYEQIMEYYPYSHLTKGDFYKALAWGGLGGTNAWQVFDQQNHEKAELYKTIQEAEEFGTNICIANDKKCN